MHPLPRITESLIFIIALAVGAGREINADPFFYVYAIVNYCN